MHLTQAIYKTTRALVSTALVLWLAWFFVLNLPKVLDAAQLSLVHWIVLVPTLIAEFVSVTALHAVLLRAQLVRLNFWTFAMLTAASRLLNFLPFKLGSLLKARFLRVEAKLPYSAFVVVMVAQVVLSLLAVTVIFLGALLTGMLPHEFRAITLVSLGLSAAVCVAPRGPARWQRVLSPFLSTIWIAWTRIAKDNRVLIKSLALSCTRIGLHAIRFTVLTRIYGLPCNMSELFVIAAVAEVGMIGFLTPHGIGQREALIGVAAIGLGLPADGFVAMAVVDRGLMIISTVLIGLIPSWWLWRRALVRTAPSYAAEVPV